MNYHYIIMVIKKLIETTPKSLKLFGIGELTPFFITPKNPLKLGTLTPVSGGISL